MGDPVDEQGSSIGRNTAVLAGARILERAGGFAMSIIVASKLGATGMGAYATATAVFGLLAIAGEAGTTNFLVREISRDRSRAGPYIVHVSIVGAIAATVVMAALFLVIPLLGYEPTTQTSVMIVALAVLPTVLNSIQEAAFVAFGRVELETLTTFVATSVYIAIGGALLVGDYGVPSVMVAFVAVEYVVTIVYFVLITRYITSLRVAVSRSLAVRLVGEMKAFTASSALAAFFARPEVIILSLLVSPAQVGYYGAAVRIAELPLFLPQVFMANVFPLLSRSHGVEEHRFVALQQRAFAAMLAFAVPLAAFLVVLADVLVTALYGDGFDAAVTPLRILAFNVLFFSLIAVLWRSLAARGRQDAVLKVQAIMVVIRLGGGAAVIAALGIVGAAVTTAAAAALQFALLARSARRSGAGLRLERSSWRVVALSLVAACVLIPVSLILPLWAVLGIGGVLYLAVVLATDALPPPQREALLRRLHVPRRGRADEAQGSSQ